MIKKFKLVITDACPGVDDSVLPAAVVPVIVVVTAVVPVVVVVELSRSKTLRSPYSTLN